MELPIEPKPYPRYATKIKIDVAVVLNEKAIISVLFYEENTPLDMKRIEIEGDEYKAWGNDDAYLEQIIYSKLGLEPKQSNPPDPTAGHPTTDDSVAP